MLSLPSRECGLKSKEYDTLQYSNSVTPFAGVWIEILEVSCDNRYTVVTPFAGVWIEIVQTAGFDHPPAVTPFAGVWIEMRYHLPCYCRRNVTPFAGVWIEIRRDFRIIGSIKSLPSRECGGICGGRAAGRCR